MILIKNAKIYTMGKKGILEKGSILLEDNKILEVGTNLKEDYAGLEIIDAEGKIITPGLVEAHCHVGLHGDSSHMENVDYNETSSPITPQLRAIDAINPLSRNFKEAAKGGVTTIATGPGSANVIGGQFAAVKTYGESIDEVVIKECVAMKSALGENPKRVYGSKGKTPNSRMATASLMRETLFKAREYMKKKSEDENLAMDMGLEALIPVLKKEIPMKVHAHRADDILTAIRIAKEFDIKITLDHCTEGHLIPKEIKKSGYMAIVGPSFGHKTKLELENKSFETARVLSAEGIKLAITTDSPVIPVEYLNLMAMLCVREGMDKMEALKAITINAAELLNLQDRVGSIEENKDADIVIWNGDPLDVYSKVEYTIINGKIVYKK